MYGIWDGEYMGLSGKRWETIREMAYKRDRAKDAPCWICGRPIDYRAKVNPHTGEYNPNAWEPDHYFTQEEHPELAYDLANLRPSHARCNRARGQLDGTEHAYKRKIGNQSRDWGIGP